MKRGGNPDRVIEHAKELIRNNRRKNSEEKKGGDKRRKRKNSLKAWLLD